MHAEGLRANVSAGLVALATAWPTLLCAIVDSFTSPLQRAMAGAICGEGPGAVEFLGHCPACWTGAAAFLAAAALTLAASSSVRRRV